ncbi:MAG: hypothetical protein VST68_00965 [Nitrospirota bacterium]|nr:hypothetical protein [Nitrospirota bacterium]
MNLEKQPSGTLRFQFINSHTHYFPRLPARGNNIKTIPFPWMRLVLLLFISMWHLASFIPTALGMEKHQLGHSIPGVPFQVFIDKWTATENELHLDDQLANDAIHTVVEAFTHLIQQRLQYTRFDEALTKNLLKKIVIEPIVLNREGKEFPFLVARTKQKGKVKLLINASQLQQNEYLHHPEILAPRLAKEFQWVVSKANTSVRPRPTSVERDLRQAPIFRNADIKRMPPEERQHAVLTLFKNYLSTSDEYKSLANQPYYEQGTTTILDPDHPFSTAHFYEVKIREALQLIVGTPYFHEYTPKAVRSLLNGKIWNVAFVKIDSRDWTTRTRVLPKDKAVEVGGNRRRIQPAKVLLNYHRILDAQDPLFAHTRGLPMGALSVEQLARVIAWEIQNQITEKSMQGHVAEDEKSARE